jgi:hypothetical protein
MRYTVGTGELFYGFFLSLVVRSLTWTMSIGISASC